MARIAVEITSPSLGTRGRIARTTLLVGVLCALGTGCAWLPWTMRTSASAANGYLEQANHALDAGEPGEARKLLTDASRVAPDDPEIQRAIGKSLLLSGDVDQGMKHIRYSFRHGVDDPDAYVELARVLVDAGRYADAQEMIDASLRLVPTQTAAQLLNGRLAELKKNDEEALNIYYRLLGTDPSDTEATLRVADVLVRMNRSSHAAPLLRGLVDSDRISTDERVRARWMLGMIYGRERRWGAAADQLASAAAQRAQLSADECYQVAYASWEAGRTDRAAEFVTRTLAINPTHPDALALAAATRSARATRTAYTTSPVPAPPGW